MIKDEEDHTLYQLTTSQDERGIELNTLKLFFHPESAEFPELLCVQFFCILFTGKRVYHQLMWQG